MELSWMLGILLIVLVACIIVWAAQRLMAAWNVGEPIATTVYVVLVVIFAIAILSRIFPGIVTIR